VAGQNPPNSKREDVPVTMKEEATVADESERAERPERLSPRYSLATPTGGRP
jgi:hypothetical protein